MIARRAAGLAALLSFVLPGLGQAYAGRPARALLFALPMLLVLLGALLLIAAGPASLLALLLRQEVLSALAALNVGLLLYRLAAIVDAYTLTNTGQAPAETGDRRPRRGRLNSGTVLFAAVLVATLGMHGLFEIYRAPAARGLGTIFHDQQDAGDWTLPEPGWDTPTQMPASPSTPATAPPPTEPGSSPAPGTPATPSHEPSLTPIEAAEWARDGRLNIVLLGSDEGPGRWSLRPDAIFLLSVDIESKRSALFGFWRYMSSIPLPPESAEFYENGRFAGHFNAIYRESQDRPARFPGNDARGLRATAGAVQELAGVRVDHYVMVNLNGFVDVIEAMSGLWIDIPEPVRDRRYGLETGGRKIQLQFRTGCQHLDGRMALAYARTRHQDGDWSRMGRQQLVMAAMRRQFDPLAVLPELPHLFDVAGENLYWTLGEEDVIPMAQLAAQVDVDRMQRVLFVPPDYQPELTDETIDAIRAKVRGIFDEPEAPSPSPRSDGERCPPA